MDTAQQLYEIQKDQMNQSKAQADGIRICPSLTREDFQRTCRIVEDIGAVQLPEENMLQVVVEGLSDETRVIGIANYLKKKGYNLNRVTKTTLRRTKGLLPMYMIELSRKEDKIFRTSYCLKLTENVERHRRHQEVTADKSARGSIMSTCPKAPDA